MDVVLDKLLLQQTGLERLPEQGGGGVVVCADGRGKKIGQRQVGTAQVCHAKDADFLAARFGGFLQTGEFSFDQVDLGLAQALVAVGDFAGGSGLFQPFVEEGWPRP